MGLFKIICWALIFLTRLRFPPGSSIAIIWKIEHLLFSSRIVRTDLFSFIKSFKVILTKRFVLIKLNRNFNHKYDDKQFKYKLYKLLIWGRIVRVFLFLYFFCFIIIIIIIITSWLNQIYNDALITKKREKL